MDATITASAADAAGGLSFLSYCSAAAEDLTAILAILAATISAANTVSKNPLAKVKGFCLYPKNRTSLIQTLKHPPASGLPRDMPDKLQKQGL